MDYVFRLLVRCVLRADERLIRYCAGPECVYYLSELIYVVGRCNCLDFKIKADNSVILTGAYTSAIAELPIVNINDERKPSNKMMRAV